MTGYEALALAAEFNDMGMSFEEATDAAIEIMEAENSGELETMFEDAA